MSLPNPQNYHFPIQHTSGVISSIPFQNLILRVYFLGLLLIPNVLVWTSARNRFEKRASVWFIYFGKPSLEEQKKWRSRKRGTKWKRKPTGWCIFKQIPTVGIWNLILLGIFAQTSHHCRRHRITVCQRQRKRSPYPLTLVPPFVKGHQRLGTKGSYMTKNVQMVSPKSSESLWQKSLLQKKARGNRYLSLLLLGYICRKLFPTMTEEY